MLDTGVKQNHPSLDRVGYESTHGTGDSDGHGTKVAGIIYSNHSTYRGMAYSLDHVLVGDCINSMISHGDWMVGARQDDPEVINMSCGSTSVAINDYNWWAKFFDGLVDDHRVLFVNSAGNEGGGTSTLTHPSTGYNLIAVANVDDKNTGWRSDDRIRSTPVGPWITVANTGGAPAHSIAATISGDWTLLTTTNSMPSIDSGASYPAVFTALTRCKTAGESQTVTVTSDSYGETFTATTSYTITCG
ncbi:MAG: S8 family serine peptidase [Acidobacteriota bacterium]